MTCHDRSLRFFRLSSTVMLEDMMARLRELTVAVETIQPGFL